MDNSETTPAHSVDNSVEIHGADPMDKPVENSVESGEKAAEDSENNKQDQEIGGPKGPEPTRFGDWERNGRCSDF